jgi:putative tricarboxylic transport membrane protein
MSDRLLGGVCVALAGAMAWHAQAYVAPISYEPVGPRAFPMLLAALMALCGLWLLVKPAPGGAALNAAQWRRFGLVAVAVLAYAALFETLGFPLATAVMTVPVALAFGGEWKKALGSGLVMGVLLYLLFDRLLDVVLPGGVLGTLMGGR